MKTTKEFLISTLMVTGIVIGTLIYQPIAERRRAQNILNIVTNSAGNYWADRIGNDDNKVQIEEAVTFSDFLTKHGEAYVIPRTNTQMYKTLEQALDELKKRNLPQIDNFVFRLNETGTVSEIYKSNGKRTFPKGE